MKLRYGLALILLLALSGCASERHFARDSLWPFGNPNAPNNQGETAERALGRAPAVTPIAPQAGNVWPGPVQPVPTIADIEANMNQPLGKDYIPSLPSPYPPGQAPADQDSDDDLDHTSPSGSVAPVPRIAPAPLPQVNPLYPGAALPPGAVVPGAAPPIVPGNPHVRE